MTRADPTPSRKVIVMVSRLALIALVSVVLLFFLAPWPGLGMIYSITDPLRGHPESRHGTQPSKFVGLWIKEAPATHGFLSKAFYLMDDANVAVQPAMATVMWHFDKDELFLDYVSRCGNGYVGVQTSAFSVKFDGKDRMDLNPIKVNGMDGVEGWYERVPVTSALRKKMQEQIKSESFDESRDAYCVLGTIDQYEFFMRKRISDPTKP